MHVWFHVQECECYACIHESRSVTLTLVSDVRVRFSRLEFYVYNANAVRPDHGV